MVNVDLNSLDDCEEPLLPCLVLRCPGWSGVVSHTSTQPIKRAFIYIKMGRDGSWQGRWCAEQRARTHRRHT